jgi:hypothetical protein
LLFLPTLDWGERQTLNLFTNELSLEKRRQPACKTTTMPALHHWQFLPLPDQLYQYQVAVAAQQAK